MNSNNQVVVDQFTIEPVAYDGTWLIMVLISSVILFTIAVFLERWRKRAQEKDSTHETAIAQRLRNIMYIFGGIAAFALCVGLTSIETYISRATASHQAVALEEQLGLDHVDITVHDDANTVVARDTRNHPDGLYLSGKIVWVEDTTYLLVRDEH